MDLGGLPERAAFDFGCSNGKLRYWKLDDLTVGVTGCGKRGTYVQTCRGNWGECPWILNGAIESTKQKRTRKLEPEPEPKPEPEPEPDSPDEP